jgi:8-oxo-dGTP pyrophosphatase MutT (NUDIX family)
MKKATMVLIFNRDKSRVLLGYKKLGEIGQHTLNGPGGKNEPGESSEDCIIRETFEEVGIVLNKESLIPVALVTSYVAGVPDFEVTIFHSYEYAGHPIETAEMIPEWCHVSDLPFAQMLEGDRDWLPRAIRGESFHAHVYYKERVRYYERTEFV